MTETSQSTPWAMTDEELATRPLAFREGLFAGRTFLVSGGGSGIGRAIAYLCSRLGGQVMICGRDQRLLTETQQGIRRHLGKEIAATSMSLCDPEAVKRLIEATHERFGALHAVVNNGGGSFSQAAIDFSVKDWLALIDTDLNGTWYLMQAAAQYWRDQGSPGNIVNIVAPEWRGLPQVAHTCAARAGVIHLSKTVSTEWAPLGIRVNCVSPGSIDSDGLNAFDIGQSVVYLSAPTGKFITGGVLMVDGGNNQKG